MADIANLGFSVQTGELEKGRAALEALVPAAQRVSKASVAVAQADLDRAKASLAATRATEGATKADIAAASMAVKKAAAVRADVQAELSRANAVNMAAAGTMKLTGAVESAAAGNSKMASTAQAAAGATAGQGDAALVAAGKLSRLGEAANDNINRMQSTPANIAAQFQDIGVTAAAGMNPLLIALQQGTQLSAALAGGGLANLAAAFKQVFSVTSLLTIGVVALVAGLIQLGISLFTTDDAAGKTAKSGEELAHAFDYTKQASDALVAALDEQIQTQRRANDVSRNSAVVAYDEAKANLTKALSIREVLKATAEQANDRAIGSTDMNTGFVNVIMAKRANDIVSTQNAEIARLNTLIGQRFIPAAQQMVNDPAGAASDRALAALNRTYNAKKNITDEDRKQYSLAYAKIKADEEAANKLLNPGHSRNRRGPRSEGAKFSDIVTGAENDIAKESARATAFNLSAEAAAKLEFSTKLVSEANTKGITLTEAMAKKIDALSDAYARAKVAADNTKGLLDVLNASEARKSSIQTQIDQMSLYGFELAYAVEMEKQLADAHAKNMSDDAIKKSEPEMQKAALGVAGKSVQLGDMQYAKEMAKKTEMERFALERQRGEIGLGREALAIYRRETDLLTQAKQHLIETMGVQATLAPQELDDIHKAAVAHAEQTESLRKLNDAMDSAKETTKGFFSDLYQGVRDGKSVWDAFGDAALNALDKIINKLMDNTLNDLIDGLFSGGSSGNGGLGSMVMSLFGGGFAKGGSFDSGRVTPFADGGAFTNGIYNQPTMFAFANGGALGVMGEAGPEAIMPLHRGSDGSLGVQMHGAGGGGSAPVTVNVVNNHTLTGAISSEDVVALNKRSAEQTKAELRRAIPGIIEQYQRDGALA